MRLHNPHERRSFEADGSPVFIATAQREIRRAIDYWQCTNREIAEEAGCSESTVRRFYHGLAVRPSVLLLSVLKACGWTVVVQPGEIKGKLRKVA